MAARSARRHLTATPSPSVRGPSPLVSPLPTRKMAKPPPSALMQHVALVSPLSGSIRHLPIKTIGLLIRFPIFPSMRPPRSPRRAAAPSPANSGHARASRSTRLLPSPSGTLSPSPVYRSSSPIRRAASATNHAFSASSLPAARLPPCFPPATAASPPRHPPSSFHPAPFHRATKPRHSPPPAASALRVPYLSWF